MIVFPAIDMINGAAVRLTQGDYARMTVYDADASAVAARFHAAGAAQLHLVDLDGARTGEPQNTKTVAAIAGISGLFVQLGGGIRSMAQIERCLSLGISRVILGTAAVRDPTFCREAVKTFGGAVAVGVDARGGKAAISGWQEDTALESLSFCRTLRDMGVQTVIYTDIARDGVMAGANLDIYEKLCALDGLDVIASGGVCRAEDITALAAMGLYGAIVGKALYEGALTVEQILFLAKDKCATL